MMASAGSAGALGDLAGRVGGHKEQRAQSQRHERGSRGYGCGPEKGEAGLFTGYFILHTLRSYGRLDQKGKSLGRPAVP